jgi:hypothetical protein
MVTKIPIANLKGDPGDDGTDGLDGAPGPAGPRGQDGANVLPTQQAVSAAIARVDIRDYVLTGESLVSDGTSVGDNTTIIHRAVIAVNNLWLVDHRPRQIFFPDGVYLLADSGAIPGITDARYCVRWRSGAGIATSSFRGVTFVPPATATAFVAAGPSWGDIEDVYIDAHVVDGKLQTNSVVNSKYKGWFIQGLKNSHWDGPLIQNCFSTGWGNDYLRNVTGTLYANGNGRGMLERQADVAGNYRTATATAGSATLTSTTILAADAKRPITGPGIPANSYVGTVVEGVSFKLTSDPFSQVDVLATASGANSYRLSFDPMTSSGNSGVGIGTGRYVEESFDLTCYTDGNGFHGTFTETQGAEPQPYAAGAQRLYVFATNNHTGFRDCGSNGLESWVTTRGNRYAEILHDKTILNDVLGKNGICHVNLVGGSGKGIMFGAATQDGPYVYSGTIRNMAGDAVGTKAGAKIPPHLTLDLTVNGCGGGAVAIDKPSLDMMLKVREWGNGGLGLALTGTGNATDLSIVDSDFRSGGALITQSIVGNPVVSSTTRGLSLDSPAAPRTTQSGTNAVALTWTPPLLAATVTDYVVQYRLPEASTWTTFTHAVSSATALTVTGLLRGHTYDFRIAAVAGSTTGPFSPFSRGTAGIPPAIDRFNRASGTLAGSTLPDGTASPVWSLATTASGVIGVFGSIVAKPIAGGAVYATIPVAVTAGAVQMKIHAVKSDNPANRRHGLVFAYTGATDYYRIDTRPLSTDLNIGLRKVIGGTATILSSYSRQALGGDVVRVEFDATSKRLAWYVNEEFVGAVVDSAFPGSTAVGMYGDYSSDTLSASDDFMAWI